MYDMLFTVLFLMVLPFWAAMILAPGWRFTPRRVATPLIALPPAVVYAVLVLADLDTVMTALLSNDVAALAEFLGTPAGATIAWAHFLAGDLFLGRWIYPGPPRARAHGTGQLTGPVADVPARPAGVAASLRGARAARPPSARREVTAWWSAW